VEALADEAKEARMRKLRIEFVGDGLYEVLYTNANGVALGLVDYRHFEDMNEHERRGVQAINAVAKELDLHSTEGIKVEIPA
jgi:hypothetical protein